MEFKSVIIGDWELFADGLQGIYIAQNAMRSIDILLGEGFAPDQDSYALDVFPELRDGPGSEFYEEASSDIGTLVLRNGLSEVRFEWRDGDVFARRDTRTF